MENRDPHQALKSEIVAQRNVDALEVVLAKLQWGKDDIAFSLHVNPTSFSTAGLQKSDFLAYLGFHQSGCSFTSFNRCYVKWANEDFDIEKFAQFFERAYVLLGEAQRGLENCGFRLPQPEGWGYFLGNGRGSSSYGRDDSVSGDGHTGMKVEAMKLAEDATFFYRFTFLNTGREKGFITHYRPKHPPLSQELLGVFRFLGLSEFSECPEFEFEHCYWRSVAFQERGDNLFGGNVEWAHHSFDAHATQFSPAVEKLLGANAEMEQVGLSLSFLTQTKAAERLKSDIERRTVRPMIKPVVTRNIRAPEVKGATGPLPERFDVAISFAGTEREYAEQLANHVIEAGFVPFYDNFYPEHLWGKNLTSLFDEIYRKRARFCIPFVSKEYRERKWTNHEFRSAQARALEEKGNDYILPIKVDDTELDGLPPNVGYLTIAMGIEKIAELLIKKMRS